MFWRFSHIFLLSLTNQKSTFQRKLYGVLSHCFNISSWNIHESYSALPRKSFQIVLVVWKHENKNNWRENKKKLEEREFETEKILRIKSFKICPKSFMLMTKETLFVRLIKFYEFMWHASRVTRPIWLSQETVTSFDLTHGGINTNVNNAKLSARSVFICKKRWMKRATVSC